MKYDITLFSTADWDNPFWTNKQHVAVQLARLGYRILYIDSIGLRTPTASAQDIRRLFTRLMKALRPPRQVRSALWVWSPIVIPFQRFAAVRLLNRALLGAGLFVWQKILRIRPDILWTYNPMTSELMPTNRFAGVVYHCVDAINAQPGMPSQQIKDAERHLLKIADICFATAKSLFEKCKSLNANTFYFSNVADFDHFALARAASTPIPADIADLGSPIVGFIGAISRYKVDFELLSRLADARPSWCFVLIGKVGEGDPTTDVCELMKAKNIMLLGPRKYEELPGYLKAFDVALLPCVRNEYTDGMFPMKFFEYLASGKPVVSTNLPALHEYAGVARMADGLPDFISGIEEALAGNAATLTARLAAAQEHTYEIRTARMIEILDASLRTKAVKMKSN